MVNVLLNISFVPITVSALSRCNVLFAHTPTCRDTAVSALLESNPVEWMGLGLVSVFASVA